VRVHHGMIPVTPAAATRGARRPEKELAMRDGYVEVPVTSRAAQAELERQEARRRAALSAGSTQGSEQTIDPSTNLTTDEAGPERAHDAPTPLDS
jgi:hypothetical protein